MKRKIFEKQIIDFETGEITSVTTVTASKYSEAFFMGRRTDDLSWLYELSGAEIKTIIFLLDLEELPKGENVTGKVLMRLITLGKTKRDHLLEVLECSSSYLSRLLKRLEDKQWIIRVNKTDFILNPKGFYKGSSKDVAERINEFNNIYASKCNSTTNPDKDVDSSESKQ